jgi:hypothetical protein
MTVAKWGPPLTDDQEQAGAVRGVNVYRPGEPPLFANSGPEFEAALGGAHGPIADYDGPEDTAEADLAIERASMQCTAFQAKAAMMNAGVFDAAEAAAIAAGGLTKLAWETATEYSRDSETIAALAVVLELSDDDIDNLFRQAMRVQA